MPHTRYSLEPFDIDIAGRREIAAVNTFDNLLSAELLPHAPPKSAEYTAANLRGYAAFKDNKLHLWHVWEQQRVVASLLTDILFGRKDEPVKITLRVLPEVRRQRIATQLLQTAVTEAELYGCHLFTAETYNTVPAGEAFSERVGAKQGLRLVRQQLMTAGFRDRRSVLELSRELAEVYDIGIWRGPFPPAALDDVVHLMQVMNDVPKGDPEMSKAVYSKESPRQWEGYLDSQGTKRWWLYLRQKLSNRLVGFTEVYWNRENPEVLQQGDTGVFHKYRGRGLAGSMKVLLLDTVLKEKPAIKRVLTENAELNGAIIKINRALGFQPYCTETKWRCNLETLKDYFSVTPARKANL